VSCAWQRHELGTLKQWNARYIQRFEYLLQNLPLQSSTTVVACRDGFVEAEIDDEILALSIEQGTCYGMNQVGSRIWNLLSKPIRICDLCAALLGAYRVDPDVCERQVLDLLEELRAEGLITTLEDK
jgi:Coenzyme PQQ synthesis protein D (PqqD)